MATRISTMSQMFRLSLYLRREWLSLILGAVLVALVTNCLTGTLGPRDLLALRRHRVQLESTRDRLLVENTQLKARLAKLRSDDTYLQRLIRQELGYARADEFVYLFSHFRPATH